MSDIEIPRLPGWLTLPEVAERLGIVRQSVHKKVQAGEFGTIHSVGRPSNKQPILVVHEDEVEHMRLQRERRRAT